MPRIGKPRRLASGIYAYKTWIRATVKVGTGDHAQQREEHYPLGTELAVMQSWQLRTRADLLGDQPLGTIRGRTSLRRDVNAYLATIADPKTRAEHARHLAAWVHVPAKAWGVIAKPAPRASKGAAKPPSVTLGDMPREAITSVMLKTILATWQRDPSGPSARVQSASSINHRLTALRSLYRVLDADNDLAPNPTLKVKKIREPKPEPREIPRAFVEAIFAAIPDRGRPVRGKKRSTVNLTKIRLLVQATTGLPPKQVAQLRAEHLRHVPRVVGAPAPAVAGHLWVTPRRKGRGTDGKWIPLTRDAADAVDALFEYGAAGAFSTSAARHVFRRAVANAKKAYKSENLPVPPLPTGLRPYDLRHTFLTQLYRHSKDRKATQGLGLHADPRTTDRYIGGAEAEGELAAVLAFATGTTRLARPKSHEA
jgi:integrase